ncbi:MAG TPA: glutaredoxin family protein [Burkholderiales bacterium]|nr:glutaredoxin family protein [Burkholderiales bacterium]
MNATLVLVGRSWCHLCEDMAQALRALGVPFTEVDVDSDPRLESLYDEDVPVLLKDGVELCRHRLTPEAIARLR